MNLRGRNGQLVIDARSETLTFIRDGGFKMKVLWGNRPPETVEFRALTDVHLESARFGSQGYLSLGLNGEPATRGDHPAAAVDPRCVTFPARDQPEFVKAFHHLQTVVASQTGPTDDPIDGHSAVEPSRVFPGVIGYGRAAPGVSRTTSIEPVDLAVTWAIQPVDAGFVLHINGPAQNVQLRLATPGREMWSDRGDMAPGDVIRIDLADRLAEHQQHAGRVAPSEHKSSMMRPHERMQTSQDALLWADMGLVWTQGDGYTYSFKIQVPVRSSARP